jgi:hypothetical protein
MAALRSRNAVLLYKEEVTEGVDPTPTAGTDAVLVEDVSLDFNPTIVQTNEVTGSLDSRGPITGGMTASLGFSVYMKGSGAAGTAPEFGEMLKACGWGETVTGTAVPASPEALGTGASQTAATLGTSAGATDDQYNGMPVDFTSAVTGSGFISDYVGSSKLATLTDDLGAVLTATSNYQIPVNVLYTPASASIPTGTLYLYMDGVRYILVGNRGSGSFTLTSGQPGKIQFNFTGLFSSKADAAVPTATYDTTRPPIWKNGRALIDRYASAMAAMSVDWGSALTNPDNPNALEGFDPAIITRRAMTGSCDPMETLVATRDVMTAFRNGTQQIVHARFGALAGNRIGLTIPAAFYTNQTPGDRDGVATVTVPFSCVGEDSGAYLCFY